MPAPEIEDLKREVERNPHDFQNQFKLGLALAQNQDYLGAKEAFLQSASLDRSHFGSVFNLGLCYTYLDDYEKAELALDRAVAIKPNDFNALYNLGDSQYQLGHGERAAETFDRLLSLSNNAAADWRELAQTLINCGFKRQAFEALKKSFERDSDERPRPQWLAEPMAELRDRPDSLLVTEFARTRAVKLALEMQDKETAAETLSDIFLDHPAVFPVCLRLSRIFFMAEEIEASHRFYREFLARLDAHRAFYKESSEKLREEEIAAVRRLVREYKNHGNVMKAVLALCNGDLEQGRKALKHVQPSPIFFGRYSQLFSSCRHRVAENEASILTLGEAFLTVEAFDEALECYLFVLGRKSGDNEALYGAAVCNRHLERFEDCEKYLDRLLKAVPDFPDAHFQRGLCSISQKRFATAIKDYKWLLDNEEDQLAAYLEERFEQDPLGRKALEAEQP